MRDDPAQREKAPDDDIRTAEARRVLEEYARGLRQMLARLGKVIADHDQ